MTFPTPENRRTRREKFLLKKKGGDDAIFGIGTRAPLALDRVCYCYITLRCSPSVQWSLHTLRGVNVGGIGRTPVMRSAPRLFLGTDLGLAYVGLGAIFVFGHHTRNTRID